MPDRNTYRQGVAEGKTLQWLKQSDVNFLKKNKKERREAHATTLSRLLRELRSYRKANGE